MPFQTLVPTATLAEHLDDPAWRIFDCRHDLARPGQGALDYAAGHVPGARFAHMEHNLSGPKSARTGRHPLPDPAAFIAWLGAQGVRADHQVVAYDAAGGTSAARLWWMLRWVGHRAVAVLDGGYGSWLRGQHPISTATPAITPETYAGRADASMKLDAGGILAALNTDTLALVDARARARFLGESEPIDPVAGRIPGSRNRFCAENLVDGRFKPAETLRTEFLAVLGSTPPARVVHTCGSGVAACHNALAMEIAGLPGSRIYPGSWSDWIADPSRPRESG